MFNNVLIKPGHVLLLGATLLFSGCGVNANNGTKNEGKAEVEAGVDAEVPAIPVTADTVTQQDIHAYYTATANLRPKEQAHVVAKVMGELLELKVEEGDVVKAGDVLAVLDVEKYEFEQARARASMEKLKQELARHQKMFKKNLASFDQIEKLTFDLNATEADFKLLSLNVKNGAVRSPISGVISEKLYTKGNMIKVDQKLFTVTQFSPLEADIHVPESRLNQLKVSQLAVLAFDALPDTKVEGMVKRISPTVDATSGTFKVTVEVDNQAMLLKPGMFSRMSILYQTKKDALVINRKALIREDNVASVFLVSDQKAYKKSITTGLLDGDKVEVLSGLSLNDRIITSGQRNLKEASKISLTLL